MYSWKLSLAHFTRSLKVKWLLQPIRCGGSVLLGVSSVSRIKREKEVLFAASVSPTAEQNAICSKVLPFSSNTSNLFKQLKAPDPGEQENFMKGIEYHRIQNIYYFIKQLQICNLVTCIMKSHFFPLFDKYNSCRMFSVRNIKMKGNIKKSWVIQVGIHAWVTFGTIPFF